MAGPPVDLDVDFFCIGGAKCASTWLAHAVDAHPDLAVSEEKEPNFLVKDWAVFDEGQHPEFLSDWSWYASLWDHAEPHQRKGEFSIKLMSNIRDGPRLIKRYFPDARFLVVLRDPVRRLYSHYWHERWRKHAPPTFEAALEHDPFVHHSRYWRQLDAWHEAFPDDRFHYVLDLDIQKDPVAAVQGVYRHLDVEADFVPPALDKRRNAAKKTLGLRSRAVRIGQAARKIGLGPTLDLMARTGATDKVFGTLKKVDFRFTRPAHYPPLDPEVEAQVRADLRKDIKPLEKVLGRDLSPWLYGDQAYN